MMVYLLSGPAAGSVTVTSSSACRCRRTLPRHLRTGLGRPRRAGLPLRVDSRAQLADRQCLRPEVSLRTRAAELREQTRLLRRLDPFRDDVEPEVARERDHPPDDRSVALVARELGDERAVDLDA